MLGGLKFLEQIDVPVVQMEFDKLRSQLVQDTLNQKSNVVKFLHAMQSMNYSVHPFPNSWNMTISYLNASWWPNDVLFWRH